MTTTTAPAPRTRAATRIAVLSTLVAIVGIALIVVASLVIDPMRSQSVPQYFLYQAATLGVALLAILAMWLITGRRLQFLRRGDLSAPARRIAILGVKDGERWNKIGVTFAIILSIATAAFLLVGYWPRLAATAPSAIGLAVLIALPLSLSNSFVEEIITRWSIVEGFSGSARLVALAPWVSAVIFGSVHFIGIPGGPLGSLMAGFLAWLAARSIQDTRGIGWAWFLHFLQDIIIFTITISVFL
jgi:hypothetical protein